MQAKENKIISEFSLYSSWEEKYEHLIEIGEEIPSTGPKTHMKK